MISFVSDLFEGKKIKLQWKVNDAVKHVHIGPAVRHNLLLIFKEAVNNLAKYSEASEANILLDFQHPFLVLTIRDNGKGFDKEMMHTGNGLQNMESRAKNIGAKYDLYTAPGNGTAITLQVKPT